METKLQFFKIPNKLIQEYRDSEIFAFIVLHLETNWGECKTSQENMALIYGNNQKFYSNALNNLSEFVITKKNYQKGGTKENNTYIIKNTDDFTMIYKDTIDKLLSNYKLLSYYCKLKRWVNNETYKATEITKLRISENCGLSKNTSNSYLKELLKLKIIDIVDNEKFLNCFDLTMLEELRIIRINNMVDKCNEEENKNV